MILIDWSDLSADGEFHLLRASMPFGGRALTVYEESHRQCDDGNPRVHKRFLKRLKAILPSRCVPIIVTDAGFRTVQAMGWEFVGRVGGHMMVSPQGEQDWVRVETVFEMAKGRSLGHPQN